MRDAILNTVGLLGFGALCGGLALWSVAAAMVVGGGLMVAAAVYGSVITPGND